MNRLHSSKDQITSLQGIAARLSDARLNQVVAGYKETKRAFQRVIAALLLLAWAVYWVSQPPTGHSGPTLWHEGHAVLPWVIGLACGSVLWWAYLALKRRPSTELEDKVGALADYFGIFVLLHRGWNISISLVALMPLATIVIGARFGKRTFYGAMLLSVVMLAVAPPHGYWASRPAFIPFAVFLLVGLPLTVHRLLSTLYAVSAAAVESRDAQKRLTAMVSHELRTPLNTICNGTHLLDASRLTRDDQALASSIAANAEALRYRVNQVMDLAAIDSRSLRLAQEPFSLRTVMAAVREIVEPIAKAKAITLRFDTADDLPKTMVGDPGRIEQVVSNLASNAVKFTPPGGTIDVAVRLDATRPDGTRLIGIQVADSGIGIASSDRERIFSPFVQVSTGVKRRGEGIGLGLHISQGIASQMQSRITVAERPGGGSVFSWQLALREAPTQTPEASAVAVREVLAAHRASVRPVRCLIIDDNQPNREILRRILMTAGHVALLCDGSPGALDEAMRTPVDVIFLDQHMPALSGMEVLAQLRTAGVRAHVVMLSADADPELVEQAIGAGAARYLLKPVSPLEIVNAIAELVAAPPGQATAAEQDGLITPAIHQSIANELATASSVVRTAIQTPESMPPRMLQDALHEVKNVLPYLGSRAATEALAAVSARLRRGEDAGPTLRALLAELERLEPGYRASGAARGD